MTDGDAVRTDPNFSDERAHDLLPLRDVERLGARPQAGAELGERVAQAQIAGLINGGRLDRLPLRRDRLLLRAQRRHPRS
jgi:hypothetical protein